MEETQNLENERIFFVGKKLMNVMKKRVISARWKITAKSPPGGLLAINLTVMVKSSPLFLTRFGSKSLAAR